MTSPSPAQPADWFPLDDDEHEMQLAAVLELAAEAAESAGRPNARVLDLGAGGGRIARPLADAGHSVVAIDHDPRAIAALAHPRVHAIHADFLAPHDWTTSIPPAHRPFDMAICLGNTFMTIHAVRDALALLQRLRPLVRPDGSLLIDAIATPMWREVSEGYWTSGIAEDGSSQLVWEEGDPVFVVREKHDMDPDAWTPKPGEPRARLWTLGCLTLLAIAARWGDPDERTGAGLTVFTRPPAE